MSSHEAAGQMTGYLYQLRYALYLLLKNDKNNFSISIEKFDDIAFDDGYSPIEMIQTKHHGNAGDLSDRSVDLWKTIKVWLDQIATSPALLTSCRFLIVTTQIAADNTAASFLRRDNRNEEEAIRLLTAVAEEHGNKALSAVHDMFLNTDMSVRKKLFSSIEVVDGAPQIQNLEGKIKNMVRLTCYYGDEEKVMEQVEGWWFRAAVNALSSPNHTLLDYVTAQNTIASIGYQFHPDNLPIENWTLNEISDKELDQDQRIFVQQLRLIDGQNELLRRAVINYYRAYQQRSSWTRNELLLPNELEDYEKRLIDEWEETKALLEDDDDASMQGRELYRQIMKKENLTIRKLCTAPFVMRGSYQMLADKLDVGWHRDYLSLLSP